MKLYHFALLGGAIYAVYHNLIACGAVHNNKFAMLIYWSFDKKTLLDDEAEAQKWIFVFS